jgi:predicted SAM-dependent methyltransferase
VNTSLPRPGAAHGVVEHFELDELYWFLGEFARVLRPGGKVGFDFDISS